MSNISELANVPQISFIENMTLQETEEQLKAEYARIYREQTGKELVLGEADAKTLLLKAFALIEYQTMQYADIKGQAELLKTSTGEALDALVALLGLTRQESKKATAKERFMLAEARADTVAVPAGTRVKTQGGRYFNTLDYAEIPPGVTYVDTIVQAEEAGAESSGILTGEINILVDPIPYIASLSVPTIYKYIAKGLFLNLTQEELPRHGKKKHKYKKVKKNKSASRAPAGESIEQRPEEIDEREEFGHWEGDTVYSGKGKRKTTRALLTLTERKTRKEIIIAIPNRKAETVVKALDALERKLGARRFRAIFKSITFDNGTEFAAAEELERSCVNKHLPRTKVYFCHPYSSWERGTNENTNGMIRRRFPKGTNFAAVTNAQIVQAENWINNYPRKILGYKSSEIVFRECLRELGIAA